MISFNMKGPFWLNGATIDAVVAERKPGNFALGELDFDGSFILCSIGSSDTDIRDTLKSFIGSAQRHVFKFCYAESGLAALEKECHIYHDLSPIDNPAHPLPNAGVFVCPVCEKELEFDMK
jgi:hypothetical protein